MPIDPDTIAHVNVNEWFTLLQSIISYAIPLLVALVATYMGPLGSFINNQRTISLMTNAVFQALAKARKNGGIAEDGTVTLDMHNKILDDVLEYAMANSGTVLKWFIGSSMGDKAKAFLEKILSSKDNDYKVKMPTPISNIKQPTV